MTSIGDRVTPNTVAALRKRSARLAMDTMDAMATTQGWQVERTAGANGKPRSRYTRGPWQLQVDWNHAGHGVRANMCNQVSGQQVYPDDSAWRDPIARSQGVFRWVGHRVYDQALR